MPQVFGKEKKLASFSPPICRSNSLSFHLRSAEQARLVFTANLQIKFASMFPVPAWGCPSSSVFSICTTAPCASNCRLPTGLLPLKFASPPPDAADDFAVQIALSISPHAVCVFNGTATVREV